MELRSDILRLFTVVCVRASGDITKEFHVDGTENHAEALRKALDQFDAFVSSANPEYEGLPDYDMDVLEILLIMEDTTRLGSTEVKLAFWPEENFANFYPGVKA